MALINPFEETVVFGKVYDLPDEVSKAESYYARQFRRQNEEGKLPPPRYGGSAAHQEHNIGLARQRGTYLRLNPLKAAKFGKAYPVAVPVPRSRPVTPLYHTGKHVGHGQDLSVSRGPSSGGKRVGLERFGRKGKAGPVHNAGGFAKNFEHGKRIRDKKVNSKIPDGARQGKRMPC